MKTVGILQYCYLRFMELAKESMLYNIIFRLFSFFKNAFLTSKTYGVLKTLSGFINRLYNSSNLKGYIARDGFVQAKYRESFFCCILNLIYRLCASICAFFLKLAVFVFKNSGIRAVTLKLTSYRLFTFNTCIGLWVLLMLVCPHELWNNLYFFIASFGFLAYFMAKTYKTKQMPDLKNESFGMIFFMLFVCLSVFYALYRGDAVRIVLFLAASVVFFFVIKNSVNTKEKLIDLLKIISLAGLAISLIAIVQRFLGVEVDPEFVDIETNSSMPGRVYSTFGNPNNFAEILVLIMPATLGLVFTLPRLREKLLYLAVFMADFVAILMSYSRSCWVALFIALILMLAIYDWRYLVPLAIIGIAVVPLLPASISDRILTIGSMNDSSNAYRPLIWSGTWQMIENYFVSGVGPGPKTFSAYYIPFAYPRASTAPHSHMLYMELVIEFGIFALIGFVIYMLYVIKKGLASAAGKDKLIKATCAAVVSSMAGMSFVCFVEYVWFYPRVMFMFYIMLGVLMATVKINKSER